MLAKPLHDVTWSVSQPVTMPLPTGTFLDIDGDELRYTGLIDRAVLPSWLKLDPASGTLSGTPPATAKGTHLARLVASDTTGPAFVEFQVTVE
jgi:hypothetical protein